MKIAIVGGGVAGTLTANYLAMRLRDEIREGKVEIRIFSEREHLLYEPGLLYLIFNRVEERDIKKDLKLLLDPGVELSLKRVKILDLDNRRLIFDDGSYDFDYLVIATGSRIVPEEVPGLTTTGHWFYNLEGALKLRNELAKFKNGRVIVSVIGIPHKCPVAPIEATLLLHDFFRILGIRKDVEILYTYPINRVFVMESVSNFVKEMFDEREIEYRTFFNPVAVDPDKKEIETLEGEREKFDLLIAIPPHKGSQVITDSGINEDGWVPTDKYTLKVKGYENVFALGDTTDLPVSKAGSVAHFQAEVLAENISAEIKGLPPTARYSGKAMCFIETSFKEATYIWFDYDTPPTFVKPNRFTHWMKIAYNRFFWMTARGIL
uniref:NAD(P)/FAD-dependent oxidoreductase n=1 Tax=Archaeoglobus fulgidus TaxID=2234 RepID=A0A7J2THI3_ARCFL